MKRMYITAKLNDEVNTNLLCSGVRDAGFTDYCFVRDEKNYSNAEELMIRAKEEIEKSDWLIIDMSEKSTGRTIEAGIAYALGKKVAVIVKKDTFVKDTMAGIADVVIEYSKLEDVILPLSKFAK